MSTTLVAQGNINPSTFVKIATADYGALQASVAGEKVFGIAQEGTHLAPGITGSDGFAAHSGEQLLVYTLGDECLLKIGAGGCVRDDFLKTDANGAGVTATPAAPGAAVHYLGAIAQESAANGEYARVRIALGTILE